MIKILGTQQRTGGSHPSPRVTFAVSTWGNRKPHFRTPPSMSIYPLVNVYKKLWKITIFYEKTPCSMGKSTISTGPCSIAMFVCLPEGISSINCCKIGHPGNFFLGTKNMTTPLAGREIKVETHTLFLLIKVYC